MFKNQKAKRIIRCFAVVFLLAVLTAAFSIVSHAEGDAGGDVAGAVQQTWDSAKGQIKNIVDKVVFPVIDLVLAVFFFVKLGSAYFDYRKNGQFEWAAPAILFGCLVFMLTAPLYLWSILGM